MAEVGREIAAKQGLTRDAAVNLQMKWHKT
jgi:hypothetical protein